VLNVVLDLIVPVFGVLGVGYVLARLDWFSAEATQGLTTYTIRIAIPLMLFRAMATAELPDTFPLAFLATYFMAAYVMFVVGLIVARGVFGYKHARQGLFAFGCSYSNLVLIAIPLVLTAWGEAAVIPLFSILAVHTLALFTPLTLILETDRRSSGEILRNLGATVLGIARNQYILGILAGLAFNLLGLTLPASAASVLGMFAASATPCALFCMGAALARYRIAGEIPAALVITALKVAVFPLLVWLLGHYVFGIDPLWLAVAVTIAAMPIGINIYLFAEQYDRGIPLAATVMVVSTAVSIVTLTVVLSLLGKT
jgi:malonate transporter and related proteins